MEKMCRNLRNGFLQRDGVKMRSGGRLHFSSFSMPADERTKAYTYTPDVETSQSDIQTYPNW